MRGVLVILAAGAALSALPAPAAGQGRGPSPSHQGGFSDSHDFGQFGSPGVRGHRDRHDRHDRHDRRDRRDFPDFVDGSGTRRDSRSDAFFPYRDYQGDSLWRSDSFNDWWHDRPHRSLPRWVRHNQNCERRYWAGGGWRC